MTDAIPKAALDTETDQALAMFRDKRRALTGQGSRVYTGLAAAMAEHVRGQFPDVPGIGRIVMAVAQQIGCTDAILRDEYGLELPMISLLTITGLAAEQLERAP